MRILPKIITFALFTLLLVAANASKVYAAKIYLFPSSGNYTSSFSIDVMLSPETDKIDAVDVVMTYDTLKLDVLEIVSGDFDQYLKKSYNKATGKIEISALNATAPAETTTKIAKITFSPLSSGVTAVDFVFNPGAVDDTNALEKGIESLTSVTGGSYTLNVSGSSTTTPPIVPAPTIPSSTAPVALVPNTGAVPSSIYFYIAFSALLTTFGLTLLKKS